MIKLIFIITTILLISSSIIKSQVSQEWFSRYGGTGIDSPTSIITDSVGNVYITGSDFISPNKNIVTMKYSTSGQQIWIARYTGNELGYNGASSIKLDSKNNIIVTGVSEGNGSGGDIVTIKYSVSGEQIWVQRYTSLGNNEDFTATIGIDSLDNVFVAGQSDYRYITIKYDSSGTQKWIKPYYEGLIHALTVDKSGNIIITGDGSGASSRDVITIKYNSIGNQIWVANFNSSFNQNDYALAMGIDSQENVYVCGGSQGDLYYDDYLIVKYNSSGVEQWNRRFNGSDNFLDQARKLVIDKSDNVYITGYSTFLGTGYDFTTIKYDLNGNQLWIARYNNGSNDMAEDMAIDEYGNIYVTGISDGNGTSYDYATVKYDSSGNQLWVTRYNYSGEFSDIALALAVDNNGSVFVTGQSNRDFLTIKYSQLTGVIINESIISTEYKLSQNYPNPFNPSTIISFSIRENVKNEMSNVKLIVYDILGNEVATLVNERKNAGSYEVEFDGSNLASGIYIYKLSTGNFSETKRMMLIK